MLRDLAALGLGLCAAVPVAADSVDDYVRAVMASEKIPGVSIAIVQNGAVVNRFDLAADGRVADFGAEER